MKKPDLNFRINHQIKADEVRVISKEGKMVGIMKLPEALDLAQKEGLDLVEVAPNTKPPVVKMVDLGKFKYEQEKKKRKEKKGKGGELKEVRFSPFIAEHDYKTRFAKIEEFLRDNNKVRIVVVFMGRHMGSKDFGYNLLERIIKELGNKIVVDMKPKFLGRHLATVVSPLKSSKTISPTKKDLSS